MILAGSAAFDITPPFGTSMPGYFEERRVRAVHDPLLVKCIAMESDGAGIALVACDLIGVGRKYLDRAKRRIVERIGLTPDRVLIACTHTHTGAATADDPYTEVLIQKVADAVTQAWEQREPAEVGWGVTPVEGLAFNRRYRMKDGPVQTNPGIGNPDVVEPAGPTDPALGILVVRRPNGRCVGVFANYSLHYIGIPDDSDTISADYYGFFAESLQRLKNERFPAILSHGASGDINNIDVIGQASPRNDGYRHVERVGAKVAAAALWCWNEIDFVAEAPIAAEMADVILQRRPLPTDPDRRQADEIDARIRSGQPVTMAERGFLWSLGPWREDLPEETPTWVQAIRIGDLAIATSPGETFVEIGLRIKRQSPFRQTMVVELANDYTGYLPTLNAFEEGGYETSTSRFTPAAGETIADAAATLLRRLHG